MKAIWKNIILVSMLTQVSVPSYATEFLACKPGQILVCIPAASCRAGSIGCREIPRPAQTCFCADTPRILSEENLQDELNQEN